MDNIIVINKVTCNNKEELQNVITEKMERIINNALKDYCTDNDPIYCE